MQSIETSRRELLWNFGGGLGGIALASLLNRDGVSGSDRGVRNVASANRGAVHELQFPAQAKRVVQFFMAGAASHLDLFDYKPELIQRNGQPWDPGEKVELFQNGHGATLASPWTWKQFGECGKHLSEVAAPLGDVVDEMAFVHNMIGRTGVHSTATLLQATGFQTPGFPGMGAWISYGLGSSNENLPTFVVLPDHRGFPSNGQKNWDSGFLPASHQGTIIRPGAANPIDDLFPARSDLVTALGEKSGLELLTDLNRRHAHGRPGDSRLEARIASYELAARMQIAAPEAMSITGEPKHILDMYGLTDRREFPQEINDLEETDIFGRKCLIARRLLERGVRFIQIWSGCDNGFPRRNWDSHEDISRDHGPLSLGMARGAAALIRDLKQRGMLDETIIHWTTEFGRMPCAQGGKGRDHNPFVFTNWLAGGGIQGGTTFGPSDEWGYKPLDRETPTEVYDIHATILRQLGIDHTKLTFRHNGIDRRLTDVHGHVLKAIVS